LILTVHRLRNVVMPTSIADSIRYCLDHPPKKTTVRIPKGGLVPGYFVRRYRTTGGKWAEDPPKNPEFSRRSSDASG
jgi:hypothetical protein